MKESLLSSFSNPLPEHESRLRQKKIEENLKRLEDGISRAAVLAGRDRREIRLLAATKTVPAPVVELAVDCGVSLIGENRAQELEEKYDALRNCSVERHFIGHLQTNKVKKVVGRVSLIQSVDSVRLAREIAKISLEREKMTEILLEVNIGREKNKSGIFPEHLTEIAEEVAQLKGLRVMGLMGIPPISDKKDQKRKNFYNIKKLFIDIEGKKIDNISMRYLSMGMSGDYPEAILEGANIIRVGTALFGARQLTVAN